MNDATFVLNSAPPAQEGLLHHALRTVSAVREGRDWLNDTWQHADAFYYALVAIGLALMTGAHRSIGGLCCRRRSKTEPKARRPKSQ